ncbi:uncharacterized protein PAC_06544 [Phialocephala subalpina]|uniref:Protein kinase domain-containing protein n=1 Tax=Phialocephala subalpina TaxID=576137 RepID=A0A1L7WV54_9HELO|nr:uncharacterized protein PAC_06544 [Phialocephala subalpina]
MDENFKSTGIAEDGTFLPYDLISEHLEFHEHAVLNDLLNALYQGQTVPIRPKEVVSNYSKVFCILVSIDKANFLKRFMECEQLSDRHLPFSERPRQFPFVPQHIPSDGSLPELDFFEAFCNAQWRFCPPDIEANCNRRLDQRVALPFTSKKLIGKGSSAEIHSIDIHPLYNHLPDYTGTSTSTFALKTYHGKDAEKSWENEVQAFQKVLRQCPDGSPNVVNFYTAFKHGSTCHVILEYADRGSLEQYFMNNAPPVEEVDIARLWKRVLGLIRGLKDLHNGEEVVWHQDLKPANILVLSDSSTDISPYASIFKIAGLGTSHSKRITSDNDDRSDRDAQGTRTYGAPECYRSDSLWGRGTIKVDAIVDVFSLGCILSEVAIWIAGGKNWLLEYREARRNATGQIPDFHDGDCFHNGTTMLPIVEEWHRSVVDKQNSTSDVFTPELIPMIEEMLQDEKHRGDAKSFCIKAYGSFATALHKFHIQWPHVVIPNDVLSDLSRNQSQRTEPPVRPFELNPINTPTLHANSPSSSRSNSHLTLPTVSGSRIASTTDVSNRPHLESLPRTESTILEDGQEKQRDVAGSKHNASFGRPCGVTSAPIQLTVNPFENINKGLEIRRFSDQHMSFESTPGMFGGSRHLPALPDSGPIASGSTIPVMKSFHHLGLDIPFDYNAAGPSSTSYSETDTTYHSPRTPISPSRPSTCLPLATPSSLQSVKPLSKQGTSRAVRYMSRVEAKKWRQETKRSRIRVLWTRSPVVLRDAWVLNELASRDSVIIIDDSESMRKHWKDMTDLVSIIVYMLKHYDENGLDLYFASSRTKYHENTSTKIVNHLGQRESRKDDWGLTDMSSRLDQVLGDYGRMIKQKRRIDGTTRPLNVYVFTDANWTTQCNIVPAIDEMVMTLRETRLHEKHVGLQFISFGDDPACLGRLRLVDNHLVSMPDLPYDIVDTTPSTGNLYKMIRGAIDRDYDYVSEDANDDVYNTSSSMPP